MTASTAVATDVAPPDGFTEMSYSDAVRDALTIAMNEDERVFILGEDIGIYGGAFGVTKGMLAEFGGDRIRDTPISELGIVGAAVGAAMCGLRPVVEIQFSDFTNQAMDQIVNQAAKIHFMLGGAANVPLVLRAPSGSGTGAAAQHSQSLEAWFAHVPGLKVVLPATAEDAKGLLLSAIDDPNPVIVLEHKLLYRTNGLVPTGNARIPFGKAAIRHEGDDLTIVATGIMVSKSVEAAKTLAAEGIGVTVIDPRTLVPFDEATVLDAVKATGRVMLVQEAPLTGGFAGEIAARIAGSDAIYSLLAPIKRLCGLDAPIPYAPELEKASVPQIDDIVAAARDLVKDKLMREVPLVMPKMSMTMTEGTFLVWHRKEGEAIKAGDIICEVASDKVDMEVESPIEGTLSRLVATPDEVIAVGAPLAFINSEAEDLLAGMFDDAPTPEGEPAVQAAAPAAPAAAASPPSRRGPRPAVPFARRRASELHIDINAIAGSGTGGLITVSDVESAAAGTKHAATNGVAAAAPVQTPAPATQPVAQPSQPAVSDDTFSAFGETVVEPLSRIAKVSGPALSRSWNTIPHVTHNDNADITELDSFRRELDTAAKADGYRVTLLAFLLKGVVSALKTYPRVNSSLASSGNALVLKRYYHIGVAVDTEQGLVVPVVRDVDRKGIVEISKDLAAISGRARDGKLTGDDISGASFTVSSLGGIGGTSFTPIVNSPEAAILGVSKSIVQPVWDGDQFVPRLLLPLSLSYDHRIIDGALAARFTAHLGQLLSDVRRLLL